MISKQIKLISEKVYSDSGLGKWFNRESAGGGPGWDRYNTKGERVGKCGDADEGEAYAACLSKQKAQKLGKKKIGSFVRRKRAAQKKSGRGKKGTGSKGKKPIFVKTGVTEVKEAFETFLVENSNHVIPLSFASIEAHELLPFDTIINENGDFLNVDMIEILEDGKYQVTFSDERGCELSEVFEPNTTMGFVDVTEGEEYNDLNEMLELHEEEKKKVKLNKIMRGDVKKYKVYVKNDKGNVVKVNFGDPNMEIKRDDPNRRRNFRARHNCDNPGPRWKARYWACKTWSAKPVSAMLKESEVLEEAKKNKAKNPKKWSSCISQAKAKFDVYPSAYANAWAAKCYKSKGGKWKKLSEDIADYALDTLKGKIYNPDLFGLISYRNQKIFEYYKSEEPQQTELRKVDVQGKVQHRIGNDGLWTDTKDVVPVGAEIRTGLNSNVTLKDTDTTIPSGRMAVIPNSDEDHSDLEKKPVLKHGRADFKIDKVGFANDFKIVTPSTTLAVRG